MKQIDCNKIGFKETMRIVAASYDNLIVGRVFAQYKEIYRVVSQNGEMLAEISGKFRFTAEKPTDFPSVGDFVMLDRDTDLNGNAVIHAILPRRSALVRKAAGTASEEQIVASNVDTVFICMACNKDFNLRRLERYLAFVWDSGAVPVIVLTKVDLCEDMAYILQEVAEVAIGVDVVKTTALQEDGYQQLLPYLVTGQTVAFVGSSGVGKSTLINCLIGAEQLTTNGLRNDDKGRHTTTSRQILLLPNGALVVDTPGMRELGLEHTDLGKTFADIEELALNCKFSNCTHKEEPGCAVQNAIEQGSLAAERLKSFQKLQKEMGYDGLNFRQIETQKMQNMFGSMGEMKQVRKYWKKHKKR